jgi:hypothetical protein
VDPSDDSALVAAAQDGDRAALDTLLRRHYDRLYAVCRRLTGDDADAADLQHWIETLADGRGVAGELIHVHAAHVGKLPT